MGSRPISEKKPKKKIDKEDEIKDLYENTYLDGITVNRDGNDSRGGLV